MSPCVVRARDSCKTFAADAQGYDYPNGPAKRASYCRRTKGGPSAEDKVHSYRITSGGDVQGGRSTMEELGASIPPVCDLRSNTTTTKGRGEAGDQAGSPAHVARC